MPARRISEEAGGSVKVNGNRIAIVVIGAMPGSTPTSVPIKAPRKQNPRLAGVSATANQVDRLAIKSMRASCPGLSASPSSAPQSRDPGCYQWEEPGSRIAGRKALSSDQSPRPELDRQAQQGHEQQRCEGGEPDCKHRVLAQADVIGGKPSANHDPDTGENEPDERQVACEHECERPEPDQEQREGEIGNMRAGAHRRQPSTEVIT